jgi:DnaJ-class molecular chaperone
MMQFVEQSTWSLQKYAHQQKTSKTVANKKHRLDECPDCEGFGWNEGGKTCKGTGIKNKHLKEVMYEGKCREKH